MALHDYEQRVSFYLYSKALERFRKDGEPLTDEEKERIYDSVVRKVVQFKDRISDLLSGKFQENFYDSLKEERKIWGVTCG